MPKISPESILERLDILPVDKPNCAATVEETLGLPPVLFQFKPRPIHPHTGFDLPPQ
jgi:hypothetical protein